jgi:flagellar motor switch protein FliN/FliY
MKNIDNFAELLKSEIIGTVEGLTGFAPTVTIESIDDFNGTEVKPPVSQIDVKTSGDIDSEMAVLVPSYLATALGDLMLAGDGEGRDDMDEDDLDSIKEISSNILGSFSTSLGSQTEMPKLSFSANNASFFEAITELNLDSYKKIINFNFTHINSERYPFIFLFDESFVNYFEPKAKPEESASPQAVGGGEMPSAIPNGGNFGRNDKTFLDDNEMRNISLILDVKLPVRVRIGNKKMLLRDVLTMDIGSVVELNQLANEPLDILVDNHIIAQGEVVIVDGNFGVQITDIGTKEERLRTLKG